MIYFKNKNLNLRSNSKTSKNNNGFTLIETLVAVSIFAGSILALVAILSNNLADTQYAKKKVIATYLAQEGVEYIRNLRDTFVLYETSEGQGWNAFQVAISECVEQEGVLGSGDCDFDVYNGVTDIGDCIGGNCRQLLYDDVNARYGYQPGVNSGFVRKINAKLIGLSPSDEMLIVSTVYWRQGSGDYSVSLTDNLFNWAP